MNARSATLEPPESVASTTNEPQNATALLGVCDTCGGITAIDLDATPEHAAEMAMPGRTVRWVSAIEAQLRIQEMRPCDHKQLIEDLRRMVGVA